VRWVARRCAVAVGGHGPRARNVTRMLQKHGINQTKAWFRCGGKVYKLQVAAQGKRAGSQTFSQAREQNACAMRDTFMAGGATGVVVAGVEVAVNSVVRRYLETGGDAPIQLGWFGVAVGGTAVAARLKAVAHV